MPKNCLCNGCSQNVINWFIPQVAAETAHDMVSPSSIANGVSLEKRHSTAYNKEQPVDLREGVTKAYNVLSEVTI